MTAFANPANCLKFTVISDEQATGKLCCVALKDGCISQMDKTGGPPSRSVYDSQLAICSVIFLEERNSAARNMA